MLRLKIFASAIPLILAGVFARGELTQHPQPCIMVDNASVQMAAAPWQAQSRVSFTSNPAEATVRVQIVESAENADFAVVDDIDSAEADACTVNAATRFIGIATTASTLQPIVYLSRDDNADFRIFVQSKTFSARAAAALIVGADSGHARLAAASL
jgi:hypothetical protein